MTISVQSSESTFLGNGVTTAFAFPWIADDASDVEVSYADANGNTTILLPAQYTLVINAAAPGQLWGIGGTVTYPTSGPAIAAGTFLLVRRIVPYEQTTTILNQGNFYAQATEIALDTLCLEIQQIAARTGQFRGTWATGIEYNFGDIVIDGSNGANTLNYYMCILQNTSGTWATDLSNGDWTLFINMVAINAAVASTAANAAAAAASATSASASATTSTAQAAISTTEAGIATTQAGIATTEAGIATTQATNAAASATAAAASAAAAQNINATSATSQAITTGSLTFATQANKTFVIGEFVTVASGASAANFMHGQVTSYSGTSLVVNVLDTGGSGTHTDWNIMLSGTQGPAGPAGSGASPAGTNGQVQYNNSSNFGGFTVSGDGTLNTTTGALAVTKTGGVSFAASATTDTTVASNISSGTLAAARLPNPSSSTLGGVQSAAAVTHQWVNSISTSGVPALSQPAFTDISGAATAAQMLALPSADIYVGNVSNQAAAVAVSGDLTLVNTGAFTVAKIQTTVVSGTTGSGNVVFSASPTFTGTANFASATLSGNDTAAAFIPTGASLPANGLYLAAANTPGIAANSLQVAQFVASGTGADFVKLQSQSAGSGPIILPGSSGSNSPLNLSSLGTGSVVLYSNATGTTLATFANSGALTLNVANATVTAGSFTANSVTVPVNGVYLPSANTVGLASNSKLVATFNSPGAGGDYWTFQNVASSGMSAVTAPTACTIALAGGGAGNLSAGNYSYKITYVGTLGETAVGTVSNTVNVAVPGTNGKMALSAIPLSGNGTVTARNIYRTVAGGSTYFFLHQLADNTTTTYTDNIADASLGYQGPASQQQLPVYLAAATAASGGDTSVGTTYNVIGTTVTGGQYNGNSITGGVNGTLATGGYKFNINGATALQITDTYWNPNQVYQGAPTAWPVISSGALAGGPDNIAVISCNSSIYGGAVTGVTLALGAKGTTGAIHFLNNGLMGHVSIAAPGNTVGQDAYATPNILWLSGSQAGSGNDALIYTNYGGSDSAIGLSFYHSGSGSYSYFSDNLSSALFKATRGSANSINGIYVKAAVTGGTALVGVGFNWTFGGPDANAPIGLTANGTGSVLIYNQAGTNLLGQFTNSSSVLNAISFTGGATGQGPTITAGGPSVQANVPILYKALGTGAHDFYNAGALSLQVSGNVAAVNYITLSGATTGNNVSMSAQGSDPALGLTFYTAGTGNISFLTNNTANTILTLANGGDCTANTGNVVMGTSTKTLVLKRGAGGKCGTFIASGTAAVTISNSSIAITDGVIISLNTVGGTPSVPVIKTITAATGFTVSAAVGDTSTYNYNIISNAA